MAKDPSTDRVQNIESEKQAILNRAVKFSPTSGIYFLIKDQEIVYVGKSVNIQTRLGVHLNEGAIDFDSYSFIECGQAEMNNLEMEYILRFQPRHNKGVPKCDRFVSPIVLKRKGLGRASFNRFISKSSHQTYWIGTTPYYDLHILMEDPEFLALLECEGLADNFVVVRP